jgi:uncharacterized membrane protein required for colicin V production
VTPVDWVALAFVAVMAIVGARRGLIMSTLSFAGIVAGAILGARLAPQLLSGGSRSPYTPVAALAGAIAMGFLFEGVGSALGAVLRGGLKLEALRTLDSLGGLALGTAAGLGVVWIVGVVALQLPGQTALRERAQESAVVRRLVETVSPARVLRALARVDPLPAIAGPLAPVGPPDARVLRLPGVRAAAPSVVRILGTACGLGVEGSGWVAGRGLVVTAAHVVAGQTDTNVDAPASDHRLDATAVAFDDRNDLALLRVDGPVCRRAAGRTGRDPRLSEQRAVRCRTRADRAHGDRDHAWRLWSRAGKAERDHASGPRPAWKLRRAGG